LKLKPISALAAILGAAVLVPASAAQQKQAILVRNQPSAHAQAAPAAPAPAQATGRAPGQAAPANQATQAAPGRVQGQPATVPAPVPPQAPAQQPSASAAQASEQTTKAETDRLLRAQVLLDRAHYSPGEIDGAYGSNMRQALAGFQKAHALPESGTLDEPTWSSLNADTAPTLLTYTLAEADVAGPFRPVPEDMQAKASLPTLGYASPVEGLGEKFHASPALLEKLNPGKDFGRAGEQILVPNIATAAQLPKAARVVVSDSRKVLLLQDAAGKVIAQYPASTGSEHDPLPVGTWKINAVSPNPVYNYNPKLFWDASPGDKKVKIAAGPNNPVGVAWIDLSKPHYGIHGTPVPASIGKTESHGCIRLTNWSAAEVAQLVAAGTEVVLQD
jgi:lipoprotein-anchoring transpeptidase ErfK/SrfK